MGARHYAAQLHVVHERQIGSLRTSRWVWGQPSPRPSSRRDHLLRENGFGCVISIIPAPHNLHNYDELGLPYLHRPFTGVDDLGTWLKSFYNELNGLLEGSTKVIVHNESVDDRVIGILGGYIRWSRMVDDPSMAINLTERIAKRQLDPFAREVILMAHELR